MFNWLHNFRAGTAVGWCTLAKDDKILHSPNVKALQQTFQLLPSTWGIQLEHSQLQDTKQINMGIFLPKFKFLTFKLDYLPFLKTKIELYKFSYLKIKSPNLDTEKVQMAEKKPQQNPAQSWLHPVFSPHKHDFSSHMNICFCSFPKIIIR